MNWFASLFKASPKTNESEAPLFLTNSLSGKKELFTPLRAGIASLYTCGPTVYSRQHIGNLRAAVFSDILARTVAQAGYHVRRVTNITDVGHLTDDADTGEDKMEIGARESGRSARDIAAEFTRLYLEDIRALGIDVDNISFPRATDYIEEQIDLVKVLEKRGYTYRINDGIYFDTSKFANYGALDHGGAKLREEAFAEIGRRIAGNSEKRHPADFALWKFSPLGARRQQEWSSPWGRGFPGWHLECSAMSRALLGQPFDIHTGGMDHIPVHHTNEIAQSEAAYDVALARYWLHNAFLTIDNRKISKSAGDDLYLSDITERGIPARALRYLFLQAHYRSPLSFTWESIEAAGNALTRLVRASQVIQEEADGPAVPNDMSRRMIALLRDDLATPSALALLWDVIKDEDMEREEQLAVIEAAEQVFALGLLEAPVAIPAHIQALVDEREQARQARDFAKADALRIHIDQSGYLVEDGPSGPVVSPKHG